MRLPTLGGEIEGELNDQRACRLADHDLAMKPVLVFRHDPDESLGILEASLRRQGLVFHYVDLFAEPPRRFHPEQLSGLIVLGGLMSANDSDAFAFLIAETEWIRAAISAGLPTLGICLGAQLIAKSLGARVYPASSVEIGWYELLLAEACASDPLFRDIPSPIPVFHWHGETFDLPEGAVCLASSRNCPQQAFRYEDLVYGLQFHAEVTDRIVEHWLSEPRGLEILARLRHVDADEIRSRLASDLDAVQAVGTRLFDRFASLCARQAESNSSRQSSTHGGSPYGPDGT